MEFESKYNNNYTDLSVLIKVGPKDISDGQRELINLNAKINRIIQIFNNEKDNLIILDEPGIHLHPEWSRQIISSLIELLESRFTDRKFSIIIATHSPFLISDVPGQFVHRIKIIDNVRKVASSSDGYGQNMYELVKDTFFLNASIGAFAESKIKTLLTGIQQKNWLEDAQVNNQLEQEIALIDDQLIKEKIKVQKNTVYQEYVQTNVEFRKKRIEQLEQELKLWESKND